MKNIAVLFCLSLVLSASANAMTVWNGPSVVFTKAGSQPTTVQDALTPTVSLTRAGTGLLFNPLGGEPGFSSLSPVGTEWAFAGLLGNPSGANFSASNFAGLNFDTFLNALGGPGAGAPPNQGGGGVGNVILNQPGVVHLIADDIYFDIQFTEWTDAFSGGLVTYSRSSAVVPIPATLPLLGSAFALLTVWRKAKLSAKPLS